tara:strand:+ start:17506 stop:18222 length:717 start_codon:yes stop_codon:yes gene_type:complete
MIYLLYGTDTVNARKKLRALLDSLFAKKKDASLIRVDCENFDSSRLVELIHGQGLFEQKQIVVLDSVLEDKEVKDAVLSELKSIADSKNIFVFVEGVIDKKTLSKFEKKAEKVQEFVAKDTVVKKKFDIFSLTSALGQRDRRKLWVLYQKARMHDVSSEEIHGILFWQIKSMLLACSSKDTQTSGLNPFVFKKSSSFLKNYSKQEIENLSSKLVTLYHDARRGIYEFDIALERFILSI